jgi:putative transcriptional regulator
VAPERKLGNRLKNYRKKFKITQQELADKMGIKKSYLSDVERGVYNPSILFCLELKAAIEDLVKQKTDGRQNVRLNIDDLFYVNDLPDQAI